MCLIAFAIGASAEQPLLLAANRDEFFDRPTQALHRWTLPNGIGVLAGRDLRDGGTWLGISETGRVAMLTNVRSANPGAGRRSRGELTICWLQGVGSWDGWWRELDPTDYGGFNLVVGDVNDGLWAWISNRDPDQPHASVVSKMHHKRLAPGVYGLSNAALDTPWPKTLKLKSALTSALYGTAEAESNLCQALADGAAVSATELPETGVPVDLERSLSSPFVDLLANGYGTRSSLILGITQDSEGRRAELAEWTHVPPTSGLHRWTDSAPRRISLAF